MLRLDASTSTKVLKLGARIKKFLGRSDSTPAKTGKT
jgi:hypothetical protein